MSLVETQVYQIRRIDPMLEQGWADVVDGRPTLDKHWIDVPCLLRCVFSKRLTEIKASNFYNPACFAVRNGSLTLIRELVKYIRCETSTRTHVTSQITSISDSGLTLIQRWISNRWKTKTSQMERRSTQVC